MIGDREIRDVNVHYNQYSSDGLVVVFFGRQDTKRGIVRTRTELILSPDTFETLATLQKEWTKLKRKRTSARKTEAKKNGKPAKPKLKVVS